MTSVVGAVERNSPRVVKLLVAIPGSVSQREINLAFLNAVRSGYTECADILIQAGADHNVADSFHNCALRIAIESNHIDVVSLLIQSKCDISYPNTSNSRPIHAAARMGREEAMKMLLSAGVNPNSSDGSGNTPLMLAAKYSHTNLVKLLVGAKCAINKINNDGDTALHLASKKALGLDYLLVNGADPNIQDVVGNTPLILAATEGFCSALAKLAKYSNVNLQNLKKRSAIHYSSMKGHAECVQELLMAGADPDLPDHEEHTPLWHAIHRNQIEVVKMLLHTNCGLKSQDGDVTPLHLALEKKEIGIAKMLIIAGCDAKCLNNWLSNENVPTEIKDDRELWDWMQEISTNPFTLRYLSRRRIRALLGHDVVFKLQNLTLPVALKQFIAMTELDEYHTDRETSVESD